MFLRYSDTLYWYKIANFSYSTCNPVFNAPMMAILLQFRVLWCDKATSIYQIVNKLKHQILRR